MNKNSNTWVVGLIKDNPTHEENTWSVVGVYNDEKLAVEVCETKDHFVGPLVMNEAYDQDFDINDITKSPWPGLWFPCSGDNPWTEEMIQRYKYPLQPELKKE